jgi:hypothetical protein
MDGDSKRNGIDKAATKSRANSKTVTMAAVQRTPIGRIFSGVLMLSPNLSKRGIYSSSGYLYL